MKQNNRKSGKIESDSIEQKRQKEQRVVTEMIRLYCRKHHKGADGVTANGVTANGVTDGLCAECRELAAYASMRSEKCPFMEQKTFCSNCRVHCYQPQKREQIRKVMRYSGPRMLCVHPWMAVWHMVCSMQEKRKKRHD